MENMKTTFELFIIEARKLKLPAETYSKLLDLACKLGTESYKEGIKEGARIWKA